MNRIAEISIAEKSYPLNFSIKAAKIIAERYGGLEKIGEAISGPDRTTETIWMLALLISEGVAYRKAVDGVDIDGISAETLETVACLGDMAAFQGEIISAMNKGMGRTVEVEADPKNVEAT